MSLRANARTHVRRMLNEGASEDEILDYLDNLETAVDEAAIDTSPSPQQL